MKRSSWSKDPFALGAFSFPAVGSTPEQRAALTVPVIQRLFFAGEATAGEPVGTVQGARDSGQRAAHDVAAVAASGERIAVIGAGVAGVTAARILKDAGYNVVLVEARSRLGGRIDTVKDKTWPYPIELGSSVVAETAADSIITDLTALGVATLPFTANTETRTQQGAVVAVPKIGADALSTAVTWAANQPQDLSVADALTRSGAAKLSTTPGPTGVSDAGWLSYQLATGLEVDTGASPTKLSAWYGAKGQDHTLDRIVLGGYSKLVEDAAKGIDLLPSSVVRRIAYDDKGVSIRLATGESLTVARTVVTIPLGVLKTETVQFVPPLPFEHRASIAALGVGVVDKVWLRFKQPFWNTKATLWTSTDDTADFRVWVNLAPLTGEPVLMGLVAAHKAVKLAGVNDAALLQAALHSLEPFAGAVSPSPKPTG